MSPCAYPVPVAAPVARVAPRRPPPPALKPSYLPPTGTRRLRPAAGLRKGRTLTPEDLSELRHLVDRYADAIDRRDPDALLAVFAEDGTLTMQPEDGPPGNQFQGPELAKIVETIARYHRTFHHIGGAVFEDGEEVTGRVMCLAHHYQRTDSGPVDLVQLIRYYDRYARSGSGWRIAQRRVAVQWTELHPAHPIRRPSA